jgi:glycosyltransferase involved in cell wall biosynthesis
MHVLYFHQFFGIPKGSAGTRSYEFAKRLVANGHQVTMVCGSLASGKTGLEGPFENGRRTGVVDGIRVIELDLPIANQTSLAGRFVSFLKFGWRSVAVAMKENYDVVFATSTPLTAGIPGIFARRFRKKPFVFEVRDLWPELPVAMGAVKNPILIWGMALIEKSSYRAADRCIGLSPGIVKGIARLYPEDKISMIPNSCDLDVFDVPTQPFDWPEPIKPGDFKAVFTGTHGLANGLGSLLDAAAELKKRGRNDIKIICIGDGREKEALVARAKAEGLDNCVFLNSVPKTQLVNALHSADVGLMILKNVPAFYYGTSPNKFFDYLASRLPVLNNYPGWLAGMIEEHNCGRVVPPDDAAAFATAMEKMAADRDALVEMGKNARELANEFSRDKLAVQFEAVILEAAGKK